MLEYSVLFFVDESIRFIPIHVNAQSIAEAKWKARQHVKYSQQPQYVIYRQIMEERGVKIIDLDVIVTEVNKV